MSLDVNQGFISHDGHSGHEDHKLEFSIMTGLDLGEEPAGGNQKFTEITDLLFVSHPSNQLKSNFIEIKNLNTDDLLANLTFEATDYPSEGENYERMFGMGLKVQKIDDLENTGRHRGFSVTLLDIPTIAQLSTSQTDKNLPPTITRTFKFLKNETTNELIMFRSAQILSTTGHFSNSNYEQLLVSKQSTDLGRGPELFVAQLDNLPLLWAVCPIGYYIEGGSGSP